MSVPYIDFTSMAALPHLNKTTAYSDYNYDSNVVPLEFQYPEKSTHFSWEHTCRPRNHITEAKLLRKYRGFIAMCPR